MSGIGFVFENFASDAYDSLQNLDIGQVPPNPQTASDVQFEPLSMLIFIVVDVCIQSETREVVSMYNVM